MPVLLFYDTESAGSLGYSIPPVQSIQLKPGEPGPQHAGFWNCQAIDAY
jgi:hypothetical protein